VADDGLPALVLSVLQRAGWQAARIQAGMAHGGRMRLAPGGWPDVVALSPWGEVVLPECKSRDGVLSKGQRAFRAWCEAHGYRYVVVRSVEDVARLVERRGGAP